SGRKLRPRRLYDGSSSLATSRLLYHSLPYAISDLAPVTLVCTFPLLMVAPNSSPAKSVAAFIAFATKNKGKVTFASPGVGTVPHLAGELFKQITRIEMTHVPYRGDAPRARGYNGRAGRPADWRQWDAGANQGRSGSWTGGDHREAE